LKKLDVISNDILKRALRFTGKLGVLASEEEDSPVSDLFLFVFILFTLNPTTTYVLTMQKYRILLLAHHTILP
jgi:hypothetical protein